jgi:hypothetical protein
MRFLHETWAEVVGRGNGTENGGLGVRQRPILAETETPEGVRVVLFEDTWRLHILDPGDGHSELEPHLNVVMAAVGMPTTVNPMVGPIGSGSSR